MAAISEKVVDELPAPSRANRIFYFSGATLGGKKAPSGYGVRVTNRGVKSFIWFHRVDGRPHIETLGRWAGNENGGTLTVLQSLIVARQRIDDIVKGADPRPQRTRRVAEGTAKSVATMLDQYVGRIRKDKTHRSVDTIESVFRRLVKPAIGKLALHDVTRSHIADLLDTIADRNGPVMSDRALAYTRMAFMWAATRDDKLTLPFIAGMGRTKPKERARTRVLTDDELRAIWKAADTINAPFAGLIRFLLLTAARRREAERLPWAEIDGTIWTLAAGRNKTKGELVRPLSAAAMAILAAQPRAGAFVFSLDGKRAIAGTKEFKEQLDVAAGVTGWTLHDLRRTARTLLSRAGVPSDHAERCLGHAIAGVRATYDRHTFQAEMLAAYEALAGQIKLILNPPGGNVEQLAP
jgi:integrase